MKRCDVVLATVAVLVSLPCLARSQQPPADSKPASTNAPGQEYPRLDSQLRATFRVRAPDAQKVQVRVGGGTYDMTQDTAGYWQVTTPPLVPGFHYYSLVVGGAVVNDPSSETFFGTGRAVPMILVSDDGGIQFFPPGMRPPAPAAARAGWAAARPF
jgi:enterochelin esterase family protein